MGAKESKQSCISYEEAVKRVSDLELVRLKDAFKKSAGVGRLFLSRNAFQQDVLCEGVPPNVTDLLYSACGGTAKGIAFKDLLCGLVLLTKGSEDEKIRFLWNLYCNDAGTYIHKTDYLKAVNLQPFASVSMFILCERVNFEQFHDWIVKHRNSTVLSKWLLSDTCISLTSELDTPTFYQSLAGVTHLEEKDIGDLEKEFWRLKNTSPNGQLDLQLLGPLISPPIPKNALAGLFNAFDENRDGHIDFKELCCGVSAACRGPGVERTRFCFKIFDVDRDGVLNHDESMQMIGVLLFVAKENRNANLYRDLTREDAINDLLTWKSRQEPSSSGKDDEYDDNNAAPDSNELKIMDTLTKDNVSLTAEDFMMWSVESSLKLVQPFLDLTFEVCHIVFGLWPQCRHMEYDIVRGWLKREEKREYRVGQFWYLISRDWWLAWVQYTQRTATPCDYCRKTSSQRSSNVGGVGGIDEALVCDESFNSYSMDSTTCDAVVGVSISATDNCSLGSSSSGISTGRHFGLRPGPIDNTSLITPNPYKNVRTLTGEGGHLKRDTPLVQSHDFELVPKSLWKALNRWYGDNLPLPRQVIQPPNLPEVELELYPLNLRILLHQCMPNAPTLNSWGSVSGGYGVMASGGGYAAISATNVLQPPKRYLAYTAAFSRLATVRQIAEFLCEQLRLRTEDIRLWHIASGSLDNTAFLLEEDNMTLKELLIKDNDQVLLEIRNKDLTWPEELGSLTLQQGSTAGGAGGGASSAIGRRMTRTSIMSVHAPGATGLHNLGNTCFMNAALQVLFNTQALAQYFRRDMHLFELNRDNKLGTRGQLATRYAELLKEVWTATQRSVAPLKLRFCVTKNAPQFAGGGQHDSQELLEWFLDAMHEDLNRVMEKPYSELKDSNGRPDKVVAAEAWAQHHARNQSIVIDLFYGQLKSKVACLCCGRESVRFDPFSLLSLPLPVENYVYFEVLVILLDGSVPTKYGLRLNSEAKYIDLKRKLASLCYLNPNFMLICELWNSQIRQILPDEQKIKSTTAKELYVYQLPEESSDRSRSNSTLGMNIEKGLKDIQRSSALFSGQDSLNSLNNCSGSISNLHGSQNNIQSSQQSNCNHVLRSPPTSLDEPSSPPSSSSSLPQAFKTLDNSLAIENDEDDTDDQVATKVRRCFGNTMCMPKNLLCFKQSPELSRSPENTFVHGAKKRISSTKLLNAENTTTSCTAALTADATVVTSTARVQHSTAANPMQNSILTATTIDPLPGDAASFHYENAHRPRRRSQTEECPCSFNSTSLSPAEVESEEATSIHEMPPTSQHEQRNNSSEMAAAKQTIPTAEHFKSKSDDSGSAGSGIFSRVPSQQYKVGRYLVAVHRKITRQDSYFLSHHKTRPSLFGVPLLIPNCDGGTHKDLYCAVWLQVNRLLSALPASTDQANHAADCDDSLGYDFPFILRAVKSDGLTCALCPWSQFCRGCEIPCNNELLMQASLYASNSSTPKMTEKFSSLPNLEVKKQLSESSASSTISNSSGGASSSKCVVDNFIIAIDWDPTALHLRYQSTLERLWTDHQTISICRREQIEPVDLNHCLRAFTSEEKLEQWYHCGHCKGKKPATKKLQIWKLPPILIVHLKRFNCVNGKWVKSQKVVHFPFDDFDPTPYLASVPQETILRHKELLELKEVNKLLEETETSPAETHHKLADIGEYENNNISNNKIQTINNALREINNINIEEHSRKAIAVEEHSKPCGANFATLNQSEVLPRQENDEEEEEEEHHQEILRSNNAGVEKRKRLISTSLTKTPIVDGEFEDYHQHKLKTGEDQFDPKYKLYAVVSHSGMLNGGHYISYAANQSGSWYCYNDSSCREISQQPNIDPSSAYLLFYERQGLDYEPYLPNMEGKTLPNGGLGMDVDESDNDLKKLCTIT